MEDEVGKWFEFAENDLGVAKHLNETYYPKPLIIICYHCQQAAEKAIKVLIIKFNPKYGVSKTHNLSFLLQQIKNYVNIPSYCYNEADALTPYGIAARYPNEIYIDDRCVNDAIKNAEDILSWVKETIKQ